MKPAAAFGSRRGREGMNQARAIVVRVSRRAGSPSLRMSLVRRAFISMSGQSDRVRLHPILVGEAPQLQHLLAACKSHAGPPDQTSWRSLGSKRSRSQSPRKLNASTVRAMAKAGNIEAHGAVGK